MRRASLAFLLAALPLAAQHHRAVRSPGPLTPAQWLQRESIAIDTTDPSANDSDLLPLLPLVANARVVALGDATHGTHEFFTLKERLVPFLVARAGFSVVAFEGPYEFEKLDQYVKTGTGDPAAVLQSSDYFFWNTQEILDLIYAIRAWNAAGNPQITIAGIDGVHPNAATDDVVAYLNGVDAAAAQTATANYACVDANWDAFSNDDSCLAPATAVYDAMQAHAGAYTAASSPDAFAHALHAARVAVQAAQGIATRRASRDAALAENAEWYAANAKVIIIGHQTHFGRSTYSFNDPNGTKPAGAYLNDVLGGAYVTMATTTLHGRFNAGVWSVDRYVTTLFDYDGTQTIAALLAPAATPAMIVSFHQPLPSWIAGKQHLPIAGSATAGPHPNPITDIYDDVSRAYDAIVYVENTTASLARQ